MNGASLRGQDDRYLLSVSSKSCLMRRYNVARRMIQLLIPKLLFVAIGESKNNADIATSITCSRFGERSIGPDVRHAGEVISMNFD
jgi:hypothetical protein